MDLSSDTSNVVFLVGDDEDENEILRPNAQRAMDQAAESQRGGCLTTAFAPKPPVVPVDTCPSEFDSAPWFKGSRCQNKGEAPGETSAVMVVLDDQPFQDLEDFMVQNAAQLMQHRHKQQDLSDPDVVVPLIMSILDTGKCTEMPQHQLMMQDRAEALRAAERDAVAAQAAAVLDSKRSHATTREAIAQEQAKVTAVRTGCGTTAGRLAEAIQALVTYQAWEVKDLEAALKRANDMRGAAAEKAQAQIHDLEAEAMRALKGARAAWQSLATGFKSTLLAATRGLAASSQEDTSTQTVVLLLRGIRNILDETLKHLTTATRAEDVLHSLSVLQHCVADTTTAISKVLTEFNTPKDAVPTTQDLETLHDALVAVTAAAADSSPQLDAARKALEDAKVMEARAISSGNIEAIMSTTARTQSTSRVLEAMEATRKAAVRRVQALRAQYREARALALLHQLKLTAAHQAEWLHSARALAAKCDAMNTYLVTRTAQINATAAAMDIAAKVAETSARTASAQRIFAEKTKTTSLINAGLRVAAEFVRAQDAAAALTPAASPALASLRNANSRLCNAMLGYLCGRALLGAGQAVCEFATPT